MNPNPSRTTMSTIRSNARLVTRRPHRTWLMAAALGLSVVTSAVLTASADPTDTNPSTAPVPVIPVETDSKSLVAIVNFSDRTTTTPVGSEVRYGAAHSHLGDPPLLKLRLLDANGNLLDEFNSWHPLWAFVEANDGSESRIILDQAEGSFIVPFDRDAAAMTITDVPLGEEVAEVDLTEAIRDFCEDNPTDPSCRVADLGVTRVEAVSVPALALVGQTGQVTVETDVTNLGPTAPMDATVSYTATAAAGATVTPAAGTSAHTLALNEVETNSRTYDVSCDTPGLHVITFTSSITPSHPADIDLVSANNQASEEVTIDCVVPITIDVNPAPINVKSTNGSIPVEFPTTVAGENGNPLAFDATTIDPHERPLRRARHGPRRWRRDRAKGGVGHIATGKMTIQFTPPSETGLTAADTEACAHRQLHAGRHRVPVLGLRHRPGHRRMSART